MTISKKLKSFLDKQQVDYELMEHSLAYTAMEIAGSQHIPGRKVVKTVILHADGEFIMCALPAIFFVDMNKFKAATGAKHVDMASEEDMALLFPDFEVGAEPPFGHLYGLKIYVDRTLQEDEEIVFNAGTHTDMVKIKFSDYAKLANPIFADIGIHIQTVKGGW